jgi:hypothetical protein
MDAQSAMWQYALKYYIYRRQFNILKEARKQPQSKENQSLIAQSLLWT